MVVVCGGHVRGRKVREAAQDAVYGRLIGGGEVEGRVWWWLRVEGDGGCAKDGGSWFWWWILMKMVVAGSRWGMGVTVSGGWE